MKTDYYYEFVVLSRHLHFGRAARELFIAQSTLSSHVMDLEHELGTGLIKRAERIELTEAGSLFLDYAQSSITSLEALKRAIKELGVHGRHVRITAMDISAEALRRYGKCSNGNFSLVEYDFSQPLFFSLTSGKTDVLFTHDLDLFPERGAEAEELGLYYRSAGTRTCVIVMAHSNPLAKKRGLTRKDLKGCTFMISSSVHYEMTRRGIAKMLGEDTDVRFILHPIGGIQNLRILDFQDALMASSESVFDRYLACRNDLTVFRELDARPMEQGLSVVCKAEPQDSPGRLFVECYARCFESSQ